MAYSVAIRNWAQSVSVQRGTILDAALSQGVPVPYQCRSGQCGSCKCRLLLGSVNHDEYLPDALSERERAEGWVLACRARPKTDLEIEFDGVANSDRVNPDRRVASVAGLDQLTEDVFHLVLDLEGGPFHFTAGQFVKLYFSDLPPRSYSMANLPDTSNLEFFIREMPNGLVSRFVARQLALGSRVGLEGPSGGAFLRKDTTAPILAVAGGSGLAPILAIARDAIRTEAHRPFHLYFGVRRVEDVFAESQLAELIELHPNLNAHVVISEPNGYVNGFRTGFVHEAVAADFRDLSHMQVYTAGPPPMVEAIRHVALSRGTPTQQIFCDPFTRAAPETKSSLSDPTSSTRTLVHEPDPGARPELSRTQYADNAHWKPTKVGSTKASLSELQLQGRKPDLMAFDGLEISNVVAKRFRTGALTAKERGLAESIFRLLIQYWPVRVRKMLSAELKNCKALAHDVALALAEDEASVSLPMLRCSCALNDDDLIKVISRGISVKQIAIAQRHSLAPCLIEALIESGNENAVAALVTNVEVDLPAKTIGWIVADYSSHDVVMKSLMQRLHLHSIGSHSIAGATPESAKLRSSAVH